MMVLAAVDMEDSLPLVEMIAVAPRPQLVAALLLRLPDAVVLSDGDALREACRRRSFGDGAHYLTMRAVALDASRDASGRLPRGVAEPMEQWRLALERFAREPS